ncbi:MAG TPA: hypothetical protein VKC34_18225 [Blastocatellia bacterium]|nr:hypothetical protein [Blastocatellia bacterium]
MARKDHGNQHEDRSDELPDVSYITNEDVQHEHTDVPIKPILMFGLFLSLAAAIISIGIYFLFHLLEDRASKSEPPPRPLSSERSTAPPEPRLQLIPGHEVHPLDEWKLMRAGEEQALKSFGWVDQKSGVVRIPIDQAKKLVIQQGLPSRPQVAPEGQGQGASPGQSIGNPAEVEQEIPTDPSSGRMTERRRQ